MIITREFFWEVMNKERLKRGDISEKEMSRQLGLPDSYLQHIKFTKRLPVPHKFIKFIGIFENDDIYETLLCGEDIKINMHVDEVLCNLEVSDECKKRIKMRRKMKRGVL